MLDLLPEHLEIVRHILAEQIPDIEVRAFGSRTNGQAKKYSDLDLVVMGKGKLPQDVYFRLLDAFEDSDLPIRVDVLDWHRITPEFRSVLENQGTLLLC